MNNNETTATTTVTITGVDKLDGEIAKEYYHEYLQQEQTPVTKRERMKMVLVMAMATDLS